MNERSETTIEEQTGKLDAIDQATLTPLVQRALGRPRLGIAGSGGLINDRSKAQFLHIFHERGQTVKDFDPG